EMHQKIRALPRQIPVDFGKINIAADAQANITERRGDDVQFIAGLKIFVRQTVRLRVLAEYSRRRKHSGDALSVFLETGDEMDIVLARQSFKKIARLRGGKTERHDDKLAAFFNGALEN